MKIKNIKDTYSGFPRSVYIIFLTRVVNAMGNFVFPFMTLLLTKKLGMTEEKVGLYLLVASILQIPGSILGGKLSDIFGRKKIIITFMGLAAACFLPCAFLLDSEETLKIIPNFLILAAFFGSVANPASGAMMNDLTLPKNRQAAFSLLYMGMNAGTAIGSIIAGFLFNKYMKLLFIGDAITTIISILLLLFFVKETKPTKDEEASLDAERKDEKAETGGMVAALLRRPTLFIFVIFDMMYSFVYEQTRFSMPLQTELVFGEELGAKFFGTFNMINCLEVIILTTLITVITKKVRAIYNVSIAGIFFAVGFGMLFFVRSFWMFVLSTVIWTIGEIINATNIGVFIANHTPMSHRGRFNALVHVITGTGGAISPYIMGGFITSYGVTWVWPVTFVVAMTAAFCMFLLGTYLKKKEEIVLGSDPIEVTR